MQDIKYGRVVHRREDFRLTQGRGLYAADLSLDGMTHAVFVRSPHAHARIKAVDTAAARKAGDVVAVFTAADLDADGVRDCSLPAKMKRPGGAEASETPRPPLVRDCVRFLGEPVAMVVAKSLAAARDAAELVNVDYEPMPAVATIVEATAKGAATVWDSAADNIAYHWSKGDPAEIEQALQASHHVVRLTFTSSRVSANPMEPRSAVAHVGKDGRPTLHASYQSPHNLRDALATMFGMEKNALRVVATDVGGSFGMKSGLVREESIVFWAARKLKRPVKWVADRSEAFLSDEHARATSRSTLRSDSTSAAISPRCASAIASTSAPIFRRARVRRSTISVASPASIARRKFSAKPPASSQTPRRRRRTVAPAGPMRPMPSSG